MNLKRLFIGIVLLFTLACNFTSQIPVITPTSMPSTLTPTAALPTTVPVYVPPACVGQPVATLPAATTVAEPTLGLGTNPPLSQSEQLKIFEELTGPIPSLYVYPDFNGVDWPATVAKYRAKVEGGLDTETFYTEMQNLINELGDNHSQYLSPVEVADSTAQLAGRNDYVGIGVLIMPMLDKNRLSILLVFPGSSAEHAGLKPHDSLLAVDGIPLVENGVSFPQRVRGPACSAAVVTVQSPGGAPRNITVIRSAINSSLPIIARMVTTQDGSRIGYIYLPSFFDETIPGQVKQALQQFGQLDGLILDNRMNSGGSSDVVEPILSYFTDGVVGHFASRTATRPLQASADPINNSQTVPVVVLVGTDTVSFGEIFSGVLQDIGRAKIVGQTTLGNVEILHGHNLSDGSLLWLAEERFIPLHSQANWEKTGIVPEVQAYADWDTFTFETDPSVAAAVTLLGHK
ncbi:MAG TPA: S41 family peptidase [Anaerolineales bacterium]